MFLQVRFGTQAIGAVGWDTDDTDPQLLVSGHSRYRDAVISKFPSSLEEVRNPTGTIWETRERSKTPKASEQSMFKGEGVCGQCGLDCTEIGFFFSKKKITFHKWWGFFSARSISSTFSGPYIQTTLWVQRESFGSFSSNEKSRQMEDRALRTPRQGASGWAIKLFLVGLETRLTRERGFMQSSQGSYNAWGRTQMFPMLSTHVHMNGHMHRIHS